jgi:hypothetical protein
VVPKSIPKSGLTIWIFYFSDNGFSGSLNPLTGGLDLGWLEFQRIPRVRQEQAETADEKVSGPTSGLSCIKLAKPTLRLDFTLGCIEVAF